MDIPPYVEVDRPPTAWPSRPAPPPRPRSSFSTPLAFVTLIVLCAVGGAVGYAIAFLIQ
jgi:hypothetical protein